MDIIYRFDPYAKIEPKPSPAPEDAIGMLERGHRRYDQAVTRIQEEMKKGPGGEPVSIVIEADPLRVGFSRASGVPEHTPYALVLGCSDARVPVERIFDQSPNDLFVLRVAGNVLGTECLGSIDYAVRNLGNSLRLLVVLGHSNCGAVSAAVDLYLTPQDYPVLGLTHSLRSLVDRILIAVRGASRAIERVYGGDASEQPGFRAAMIETSVFLNAALTAFDVRREVDLCPGDGPRPKVVYGVFDIATQTVRSRPGGGDDEILGVVADNPADLEKLGERFRRAAVERHMK